MGLVANLLGTVGYYLSATEETATTAFTDYILPLIFSEEPSEADIQQVEEDKLTEILERMSVTINADGQPRIVKLRGGETNEQRLLVRVVFKMQVARAIVDLHLDDKSTNFLLGLVEQSNYAGLLQSFREFTPSLSGEFIDRIKSLILEADKLQSELTDGLLEQFNEMNKEVKSLQNLKEENLELRKQMEQMRKELEQARREEEAFKGEQKIDLSAAPPAPPPPPPPSFMPPKPEKLDERVMTSFANVLEQLKKGKDLSKVNLAAEKQKREKAESEERPLSMLELFKKEQAEKAARKAVQSKAEPSELESKEARILKIKINMGKNRIKYEEGNYSKAEQSVINIQGDIKELKETIKRTQIELDKNDKAGITDKKTIQPLKDRLEVAENDLKKKKAKLEKAEKKQIEGREMLSKAEASLKNLENQLVELRKKQEEVKVPAPSARS